MSKNMLFNFRNLAISGLGALFTVFYAENFGFNLKPLIFIAIVLGFSIVYSGIFDKYKDVINEKVNEIMAKSREFQDIESYVSKIENSIKTIRSKAKNNINFMLIAKFMDAITEFEEILPKLVENYKRGQSYLKNNSGLIEQEIPTIEKKLAKAKGAAKLTYEKALDEKRETLDEIENIKSSLDETESKLHYILSTLQKIEALIESSELGQGLSDEETTNFNTEFEAFSEVIRDTSRKVRL